MTQEITDYEILRNHVAKLANREMYDVWSSKDTRVEYFHGVHIHPAMYNWSFTSFQAYFSNAITETIYEEVGLVVPEEV